MIHGSEWDERCTLWLPESCTKAVLAHEHRRFRALVGAVYQYADSCASQDLDAKLLQQSIPWINHIHKYAPTVNIMYR